MTMLKLNRVERKTLEGKVKEDLRLNPYCQGI